MNEPLKTCPFCGGEAFVAYRCGTAHDIRCKNNACMAQVSFKDRIDKEKAAAAWNRRAPQLINGDFAGLSVPEFEQTIAGLSGLVPVIIPFLMEHNYENIGAEDAAECALTLQIAADAVIELMQQVHGKGGVQDD